MRTLEKPSSNTCYLALSGKHSFSCGLNALDKLFVNSWILDSGATDHMTHASYQFKTYTPCPSNRKITIADGTTTTVARVRDVHITPILILKNVLHVPKLSTNLVSIQKQKTYIAMLRFTPLIVSFRIRIRGKRLDVLRKRMDSITLRCRIFHI